MIEAQPTTERSQLDAAYKNPSQLETRREMRTHKYPKFDSQEEVKKAIDLKEGESLLEVGCGKGDLVNSFPEEGSNTIIGSDLSHGMARKASNGKHTFIVSDSQGIPFKSQVFDAVAAVNVIYHIPDKNAALSEISRVLKIHSRLVVTGHSIKDRDLSRQLRESAAANFGLQSYPHPPVEFNTENGSDLLSRHFRGVTLLTYRSTITVYEALPHLGFFDSMRYFWSQQFTETEWQSMLKFALGFLDTEIKDKGRIQEESIFGIFICTK